MTGGGVDDFPDLQWPALSLLARISGSVTVTGGHGHLVRR